MHLQQHAAGEAGAGQGRGHARHGAADDVGGRALDRGIDCGALLKGALGVIGRGDAGEMHAPAEDRLDIAALAGQPLRLVDIVADTRETPEIGADILARFLAADAELGRQAEGRDAIDDAEIDRLGAAADQRVHALDGQAEHLARGHGVDVEAFGEGVAQLRDVGDVGKHPELDLAVIGRHQAGARRRHEGGADAPPFLRAHRNVLQIGLDRGKAAGRGRGQCVAGMDAARGGVDMVGQRVGIGRLSLVSWRQSRTLRASSTPCSASVSRASESVLHAPVAVLRPPGSCILPKRMSPSC